MYIHHPIRLGSFRLGLASFGSDGRSSLLYPSSIVTTSVSAASPVTGTSGAASFTDWMRYSSGSGLDAFSGGFDVGGDWCLTVVAECVVRSFGALIGGSSNDEVFHVVLLCIVARFFCGFFLSPVASTPLAALSA